MYAIVQFIDKLTDNSLFNLLCLCLLLGSCQERPDMASYYFPISELSDGLVYRYEAIGELPLPDENWYYKAFDRGDDRYLVGQAYSVDGRVSQFVMEKETALGMITDSILLFFPDSSAKDLPVPVQVNKKAVFPFYFNSDEFLEYEIVWTNPTDSLQYTLGRKRRYSGDTLISFEGKTRQGVIFSLNESLETFWVHDGATNSEWGGIEIYLEGIGLYYYRKNVSEQLVKEYRLADRLTMSDFLQ